MGEDALAAAHEREACRGVLGDRYHVRAQRRGERGERAGVLVCERLAQVLVEEIEALADELAHQRLLVGEVPVDGADADTGALRDLIHLDVWPFAREQLARRLDDAFAVAASVCAQRALVLQLSVC